MGKYESKNAKVVLENVETLLDGIGGQYNNRYRIRDVCDKLSIFDWWNEYISATQLKDMRKFLKEAIKLGYNGYVCFKVGAAGCANGMWAHKEESTNGYSPDGECMYKSFVSTYNYWAVRDADGRWLPERKEYDRCKTIKQLEQLVATL